MHIRILLISSITVYFFSCKNNTQQHGKPAEVVKKDSTAVKEAKRFEGIVFDSKKDLVCGMPVRAGIEDTAHYKGKVYGFCATECKDEFKKDPEAYVAVKK